MVSNQGLINLNYLRNKGDVYKTGPIHFRLFAIDGNIWHNISWGLTGIQVNDFTPGKIKAFTVEPFTGNKNV